MGAEADDMHVTGLPFNSSTHHLCFLLKKQGNKELLASLFTLGRKAIAGSLQ